jgi:hypothetical protein
MSRSNDDNWEDGYWGRRPQHGKAPSHVKRTSDLFAAEIAEGFRYFYPAARIVEHIFSYHDHNDFAVVAVRVTEDPGGSYFAWWDEEQQNFSLVFHARVLVEMCSPDGFKADEAAGRGKVLRVRVDLR